VVLATHTDAMLDAEAPGTIRLPPLAGALVA
jgi:hypothetical protein